MRRSNNVRQRRIARPAPPVGVVDQQRKHVTSRGRFSTSKGTSSKKKPQHHHKMPQLISPLALRALRTLVQRQTPSCAPLRTLSTTTNQGLTHRATPITARFNFQPVFRTQTAQILSTTARRQFSSSPIIRATYNQVRRGCRQGQRARRGRSPALKDHPSLKGVCLKTGVTKPKKPNSGERKIARVRLSSGKVVTTIIPGEGHNIQQHSVVQVRGGRAQDCPGVKYHLVRGAMDLVCVSLFFVLYFWLSLLIFF